MKIIGDGTVGQALGKAVGVVPLGPSLDEVQDDVVMVCVPTPTLEGKQDLSAVVQAMGRIKKAEVVVLRSTVLPGTTDMLQGQFNFPILYIPEFGFEKTMEYDLKNPGYYIIGTTEQSRKWVEFVIKGLPRAYSYNVTTAVSAEFSKYFDNLWGSSQIVLANSLYDWVKAQGYDDSTYDNAVVAALMHKNIPQWGWNIYDQGFRGYGGKCLPKDTQAALGQFPNKLWQTYEEYNNGLQSTVQPS